MRTQTRGTSVCRTCLDNMASDRASRAARYREHGYALWRMSTDQSKDISFETRRKLAHIADELEDLAERVEDEIAAD
jgi:hypothetical protein